MSRIDDIGIGAAMADKGYHKGWGLGRHVLGSNYFHYVRDPWGASANIRATSTTSRKKIAGRRPTTSRRIRSISGVPTCRPNSRINYEGGES